MSAIRFPETKRMALRWPNWRDQIPSLRAAIGKALIKQVAVDPMRVFDRVYEMVTHILVAAIAVTFSSVLLLYLYATGDRFMTALGVIVTASVWLFSAYQLGRTHAAAFGLLAYWTALVPVAFCLSIFRLSPYWTFVNWLRSAGAPTLALVFGTFIAMRIFEMCCDLIIAAFVGDDVDEPTTPGQIRSWNRRQYRRARRRYLKSIEPPAARRLRWRLDALLTAWMMVILPAFLAYAVWAMAQAVATTNLLILATLIPLCGLLFGIPGGLIRIVDRRYERIMGMKW